MIKQKIKLILTLALSSVIFVSCEKEKVINNQELPEEISNYIKSNFPNNTIVQTNLDQETFSKHYEVILNDNTRLEFNESKTVVEIDGSTQIPDQVIPKEILNYVKANYPERFISDWEIDDNTQQVKLDNNMELEFDEEGNFLKID